MSTSPLTSPQAVLPTRRSRLTYLVAGLIALLYFAPFFLAVTNHFEGFTYANESIAYRWGNSSRVVAGDTPAILPQGFTILAAQQMLVRALEWCLPLSATSLRDSLQWFSWGTFAIFLFVFVLVLVSAVRTRTLGPGGLLLLFLPAIVAFYGTGTAGFYYCLLPDYYHLNVTLALATALFFFRLVPSLWTPETPHRSLREVAVLGLVLGLGVTNKITWAVPCVVAFALVLLSGPLAISQMFWRGLVLVSASFVGALVIMLVCYRFNVGDLLRGIEQWLAFMKTQQGSLTIGDTYFYQTLRNYNYDALLLLEMLTLVLCVIFTRGWKARGFVLVSLFAFLGLLWMASKRPAPTTFWDITVLTTLLVGAAAFAANRPWAHRTLVGLWIAAAIGLSVRHPATDGLGLIRASRGAATNRFDVFWEVNRFAGSRPQLVMFANNEYHHEGVHEFLLKAAADCPSWNITSGQQWLKRFIGDITFLHEYGPPIELPNALGDRCVVWFDRPDLPLLASRYPRLAALARDPGNEHLSLPVFITGSQTTPPQVQVWLHAVRPKTGEPFKPRWTPPVAAPRLADDAAPIEITSPTVTPLVGRRTAATTIELTWPAIDTGAYEIEMASGDGAFASIGRGAAQPGRYVVGDVAPDVTYRFRARWSDAKVKWLWSGIITVPPR